MSEQLLGGQPSLYGGISRQPESLRQPHQVAEAVNVVFSVVDGMSTRPPMWWVADLTDAPAATDLRLHAIYRDENERYGVVFGYNYLAVVEIGGRRTGTRCTVNLGSGVSTYLNTNSPSAKDLKLVTVGDTTYIVNTKVAVGTLASPNYTVTNTYRDYDVMTSDSPTSGTYHRATADTDEQASGYWLYDLTSGGGGTFSTYRGWYNGSANDRRFAVANGYWSDSVINGTFYVGCQRIDMNIAAGAWTAATKRITKAGAFASYTRVDGDQIYITGGTGMTTGWYPIKSKIDSDTIELEDVTGLAAANNADTTTDAIGVAVIFQIVTPGLGAADMYDVALNIQSNARSTGGVAADVCVKWTPYGDGGYFTIISPYRGSSATMFAPRHVTGYNHTASTAPFSATSGQYVITAGTGTPTDQTLDVFDRWTRQTAPNQPDSRPDPAKMPVKMVRTTVGSGSTAAVFDVSQITWDSRPSGDENSNPLPDLFTEGETIADLAFQHDRLMLFGGEYVAVGESGNLYNFFVQDEGTLVDSDAFGRRLASDQYTRIAYAAPLNKNLYIFTEAGRQFSLAGNNDTFTSANAAFTPTTTYQTIGVRPRPIHDRLYFVTLEKDKTALREYEYNFERASNVAADVSAHVPGLLPSTVRDLATSPNDNVAVLAETDSDILYVYRAHWSGDEKVQSAWTKFDLNAVCVYGLAAIKSDVYVLLRRSEIGVTIERFGVGDIVEDTASDIYPPNIAYPPEASAYAQVPTLNGDSSVNPPPAVAYAKMPSYTSITDGSTACTDSCGEHTTTDCPYCANSYVDGDGNVYAFCGCTTVYTCSDGSPTGGVCCYASDTGFVKRLQRVLCAVVEPEITIYADAIIGISDGGITIT